MQGRRTFTSLARAGMGVALLAASVGCGGGTEESQASDLTSEAPAADVAAAPRAPSEELAPVVETRSGKLRGTTEGRVQVFRGVPYGADTSGERRFRPPVARAAWEGVRDATEFGSICPQTGDVATGLPPEHRAGEIPALPVSEDCLVLNVWTPATDGGRRPVMVWFHGRGFGEGAGSEPWYHGAELAEIGDVVVVTVNHRLNVFGYLGLAELGGEAFAGSGVAGMLDAVAALEWVRDNAAAFGGDPGHVTIFGESGGGAKVSTLLAMPAAKGLFHRAIIQSGPGLRGIPSEQATETARRILAELDIDPQEVDRLQEVPVENLLAAAEAVGREDPGLARGFRPVVDGTYLPAHPFDPVAAPSSAGVPLMIGANKDEAMLFLAADPRRGKLTDDELLERLRPGLGDRTEKVLAVYRETRPGATPWDLFVAISTERTRLGSLLIAERRLALSDAPVYVYSFDWESDDGDVPLRAAHALEIPFVFNHPERVPLTGSRPGQRELAELMSRTWAAFARNGDPNHPGLSRWDPYTLERKTTMVFDTEPRAVEDLRREERLAWEGIGPVRIF